MSLELDNIKENHNDWWSSLDDTIKDSIIKSYHQLYLKIRDEKMGESVFGDLYQMAESKAKLFSDLLISILICIS